ncbi:thioredoxin domain-containing protein [Hanseniaspora valbyensis NRRL Y-1626]|uniref:Thioredoxin n=1 Tax=Hanseniaspora valbyensis NRRL Y-1626 TaxID=766949 RepID=A0A1B7T8Z8_9ASCO|nr:thioredoxin domain-containing protein [Hanseniaspora valbyensis NRRL Y-1626]
MSQVTAISSKSEFDTKVINATDGNIKLVDFYATWCGPCKAIAPMIAKWSSNQYAEAKVDFFKLDVDAVADVAKEQEVSAMPTFILFKDGKRVEQVIGADLRGLKTKLDALLE